MAPSQLGVFTRSGPEYATPNLEYHVQPLSLDKFGDPLHRFPAFTASVCNLRPTSRGHVRIQSKDPRKAPAIKLNYLSTDIDRQIAADSLKLTRRIVAANALKKYAPNEFLPGPQVATDEQLAQAAGDIGTTIFHPVGTCKMGLESDPLCRGRCAFARSRPNRATRGGRLRHADYYFRKHQFAHYYDRRKGE